MKTSRRRNCFLHRKSHSDNFFIAVKLDFIAQFLMNSLHFEDTARCKNITTGISFKNALPVFLFIYLAYFTKYLCVILPQTFFFRKGFSHAALFKMI